MTLTNALLSEGFSKGSRIAVFLPNCPESVVAALASFAGGFVYVPINPLLRRKQLLHVIENSGARTLLTTRYLFAPLASNAQLCDLLDIVVLTDSSFVDESGCQDSGTKVQSLVRFNKSASLDPAYDSVATKSEDPAVLFYTSGSTGKAKGVLASNRNILDGARIVSSYLGNNSADRLLAALPLSFDYGFSQVTTALYVGAEAILTNYTMPQPLLAEVLRHRITGLAGVPTMWAQLSRVRWPDGDFSCLRYVTNSGGRMPSDTLAELRRRLSHAEFFLMYGLTEAFRSTYLDPARIDDKRGSIGRSIPEVELFVINEHGELCEADEPGELVHCGALVTMGYWNDDRATRERFRPLPKALSESTGHEGGVWSGDIVRRDSEGFLYFIDRTDNLMKCSGYRVSPSEIEDVIIESGLTEDVVAIGIPDSKVGQRVCIALVAGTEHEDYDFATRQICARELPPYMQPAQVIILDRFPLTPNGKPDRPAIKAILSDLPIGDSDD